MNSLFASTARGLEELLKTELEGLGAQACQVVQGGVHYQGDSRLLYQSLMWSRLASRILLPLNECSVYSDLDLYLGVQTIDIGVPTFAMHSIRELAGSKDLGYLLSVLQTFYNSPQLP